MHQIYGAVEVCISDEWYEIVNVSNLLLQHADLNGCLFGVDNYAQYAPLFADRGIPADCSETLKPRAERFRDEDSHASWALWAEIKHIDWTERAIGNDRRISELARNNEMVTKWLNKPGLENVRDALDRDPNATVELGERIFRRNILTRNDSLRDTEFPLVMKLMACLAERFTDDGVRLTVWFG